MRNHEQWQLSLRQTQLETHLRSPPARWILKRLGNYFWRRGTTETTERTVIMLDGFENQPKTSDYLAEMFKTRNRSASHLHLNSGLKGMQRVGEQTLHCIKGNQFISYRKVGPQAYRNTKEAVSSALTDLRTLIQKSSVDPEWERQNVASETGWKKWRGRKTTIYSTKKNRYGDSFSLETYWYSKISGPSLKSLHSLIMPP